MKEHKIQFGTLHSDGTRTDVRYLKQSDVGRRSFFILSPEHYREDGTCKCNDPEHRKMMIKKWGYSEKSFKNIPIK